MTQQFWLEKTAHQLAVYLDQKTTSAKTTGDILNGDEMAGRQPRPSGSAM
jgi:hypothetical protein